MLYIKKYYSQLFLESYKTVEDTFSLFLKFFILYSSVELGFV